MKIIYPLILALSIGACQDTAGNFTTSEDVNGTNPEAAQFAVFGADVIGGVSLVMIAASNNPDPCSQIGADPTEFFNNVLSGNQDGTFVFIGINSTLGFPTAGQLIQGNTTDTFVSINFFVEQNGQLLSDVAMSEAVGSFETEEFIEGDILSGNISGTLDDGTAQPILFSGQVTATHCQNLTDNIDQF